MKLNNMPLSRKIIEYILLVLGLLIAAFFIVFTVNYFNKSKNIVDDNANSLFVALDSADVREEFEAYNDRCVDGSIVISMIERLSSTNSDISILIFTNSGHTVSEYTKFGASDTKTINLQEQNNGLYYKDFPIKDSCLFFCIKRKI